MTTSNTDRVVGRGAAPTISQRPNDRPVQVPRDLPGIVIFIHGVNDPGVNYQPVEQGLCEGLNERLSRTDLTPGEYGAAYADAKNPKNPKEPRDPQTDRIILSDPDTYEYLRAESKDTHSAFIPFYWGYRAANNEIATLKEPGVVDSRAADAEGHLMTRGQFQDKFGNRLDANFGKQGGFFDNATNNIADMYGAGQTMGPMEYAGRLGADRYSYIGASPHRRYFVLAAHRLAMLIRTIRSISAGAQECLNPANETISIVAHSQGTLISLLAQALLLQQGERCVDCLIMVDSPYGFHETRTSDVCSGAKLQTFKDIVAHITQSPHMEPDLATLMHEHADSSGRAGRGWTPQQGTRKDKQGNPITFVERDNRGKVYMYFCPEDTVVALDTMQGIGTFGVPDSLTVFWGSKGGVPANAMLDLVKHRFYQRMWTRLMRSKDNGRPSAPVLVGTKPGYQVVRDASQRLAAGPEATALDKVGNAAARTPHAKNEMRNINAEELTPPHAPELYGSEITKGGGLPDRAGEFEPDDVTKNSGLGNQLKSFAWKPYGRRPTADLELWKREFNTGKDADHQSYHWRVASGSARTGFDIEREETPAEARARMGKDPEMRSGNSYHSAILASKENHRWVTAMDVAIGQAATLDDQDWRDLLIRMGDWRLDKARMGQVTGHSNYSKLSSDAQKLLDQTSMYYIRGVFPAMVPLSPLPHLVRGDKK